MSIIYDVSIIGGGPAGLSSAIYTGRGRLKTIVFERGMPGGQILTTDWIENYPGFPKGIAPFQLMDDFRKQAERFGAEIKTEDIKSIEKQDNLWVLSGYENEYKARTIIIATGSDYRTLNVEGESELRGKGVSYCATCDAAFFKDKKITVVGGGDNALTEAVFLSKFGSSVYLIHRRDELRGEKILQERVLSHEKIEVIWDTIVTKINGNTKLESLTLKNVKTGETRELETDGVFVSIGTQPNSGFIKDLVRCDEWGAIIVDPQTKTSQEGIFAAGDVCAECPKQVATAVGNGVHAAISVNDYLQSLGF